MSGFTIEGFARDCKAAMAGAEDRQAAARAVLQATMNETGTADLVSRLEAAIPPGADIGEMVVHLSPELTMLYGRLPPRFQTAIHDHSVFACIGQLIGRETNVLYERDGSGLRVAQETTVQPGEVFDLSAEAIHRVENPGAETSSALHIYGGDFKAVMDRRSIWTSKDHERVPFSFDRLLRESVISMKAAGNAVGLAALARAIPDAASLVDGDDH